MCTYPNPNAVMVGLQGGKGKIVSLEFARFRHDSITFFFASRTAFAASLSSENASDGRTIWTHPQVQRIFVRCNGRAPGAKRGLRHLRQIVASKALPSKPVPLFAQQSFAKASARNLDARLALLDHHFMD